MDTIYESYTQDINEAFAKPLEKSYVLKKDINASLQQFPETHLIKKGTKVNVLVYDKKTIQFKIDGDKSKETWIVGMSDFKTAIK